VTDRIAGWHRCWTNAQGRKALLDARDTGITFPLRLLARTGQVNRIPYSLQRMSLALAVNGHVRGKLAMAALRGERPMASLYYEGCRQRGTIRFFVPFRTSLLSNS